MDPHHRKIDLQSPQDLNYLLSNIKAAAQQKLDLHISPSADPKGEDPFRTKVEELVHQVTGISKLLPCHSQRTPICSVLDIPSSSYPTDYFPTPVHPPNPLARPPLAVYQRPGRLSLTPHPSSLVAFEQILRPNNSRRRRRPQLRTI